MSNVALRRSKIFLLRFGVIVFILYSLVSCTYHAAYSISFQQDAFAEMAFDTLRLTESVEGIPLSEEWKPESLNGIDWKIINCESRLEYRDDFWGVWEYQVPYKDNMFLVISIVHENSISSFFFMAAPKFFLYDVELLAMQSTPNSKPQ